MQYYQLLQSGGAQRNPDPIPTPNVPEGFRGIEPPPEPTDEPGTVNPRFDTVVTNYTQLAAQIAAANNQPFVDHIIRVRPGTYTFNPPGSQNYGFQINDNVSLTIQGETYTSQPANPNSVVFQRLSSDTRTFSLFRVGKYAELTLRNVRLSNGGGSAAGFDGGAVRVQGDSASGGKLNLYDTNIAGNSVSNRGGGIFLNTNTDLKMANVSFIGNSAYQGGAIFGSSLSSIKVVDGAFGRYCALFEYNHASYNGGAISSSASKLILDYSVFRYNSVSNSFGYYDAIQAVSAQAQAYNAHVNTPNDGTFPESMSSNIAHNIPPGLPVPLPPDFYLDCDSKIPLPYFGVNTDGSWTEDELNTIRKGVARVGHVFAKMMTTLPYRTPSTAFRRVFLDNYTWPTGHQDVRFETALLGATECRTTYNTVDCDPSVNLTVYTVVHELGHVFSQRTGGQASGTNTYYGRNERPDDDNFCPNAEVGTVFDNKIINNRCDQSPVFGKWVDSIGRPDWIRGWRGWGSARCALPNPSNFQQNPYEIIDTGASIAAKQAEVNEAAADMFLNWVHSQIARGGFLDIDWGPTCQTNGVYDFNFPGNARWVWMNQTFTALFSIYGWN